jgi:hypothetical protein
MGLQAISCVILLIAKYFQLATPYSIFNYLIDTIFKLYRDLSDISCVINIYITDIQEETFSRREPNVSSIAELPILQQSPQLIQYWYTIALRIQRIVLKMFGMANPKLLLAQTTALGGGTRPTELMTGNIIPRHLSIFCESDGNYHRQDKADYLKQYYTINESVSFACLP